MKIFTKKSALALGFAIASCGYAPVKASVMDDFNAIMDTVNKLSNGCRRS